MLQKFIDLFNRSEKGNNKEKVPLISELTTFEDSSDTFNCVVEMLNPSPLSEESHQELSGDNKEDTSLSTEFFSVIDFISLLVLHMGSIELANFLMVNKTIYFFMQRLVEEKQFSNLRGIFYDSYRLDDIKTCIKLVDQQAQDGKFASRLRIARWVAPPLVAVTSFGYFIANLISDSRPSNEDWIEKMKAGNCSSFAGYYPAGGEDAGWVNCFTSSIYKNCTLQLSSICTSCFSWCSEIEMIAARQDSLMKELLIDLAIMGVAVIIVTGSVFGLYKRYAAKEQPASTLSTEALTLFNSLSLGDKKTKISNLQMALIREGIKCESRLSKLLELTKNGVFSTAKKDLGNVPSDEPLVKLVP